MRVRMHLRGSGGRVGTAAASDSTRTAAVVPVREHSSIYHSRPKRLGVFYRPILVIFWTPFHQFFDLVEWFSCGGVSCARGRGHMKATRPNRKIGEMAPKIPPKSAYRISLVIVTGSGMRHASVLLGFETINGLDKKLNPIE